MPFREGSILRVVLDAFSDEADELHSAAELAREAAAGVDDIGNLVEELAEESSTAEMAIEPAHLSSQEIRKIVDELERLSALARTINAEAAL